MLPIAGKVPRPARPPISNVAPPAPPVEVSKGSDLEALSPLTRVSRHSPGQISQPAAVEQLSPLFFSAACRTSVAWVSPQKTPFSGRKKAGMALDIQSENVRSAPLLRPSSASDNRTHTKEVGKNRLFAGLLKDGGLSDSHNSQLQLERPAKTDKAWRTDGFHQESFKPGDPLGPLRELAARKRRLLRE